jgi:Family of unknown function (DUF6335)
MAKRKSSSRRAAPKKGKKIQRATRSAKRPSPSRRAAKAKVGAKPKKAKAGIRTSQGPAKKTSGKAGSRKRPVRKAPAKTPLVRAAPARLTRERRQLVEDVVPTPPSSLDMDRHGSAARTGRAEMAESQAHHASMTPDINAGDVDVNVEDAYFVGDESPGGDNPTPDQDVVDEIGKALGVEYQDAEELRGSDKVADRDKHRWELDPASSEDYKNRK